MAVEIKHIIKRDGSVKDFDVHKIVYAIECAGKATNALKKSPTRS